MDFTLDNLARKNIREMKAYSTARHEFSGEARIFLDANENPFGSPLEQDYNRYPDPMQQALKEKISRIKGVPPSNIFLGNGSDEAIDLLFRIFCEPGKDNAIVFPPTYGMYEVCAAMNDILIKNIPLTDKYQLDLDAIEDAIDPFTKLIFICSPNNPTGNSIERSDIEVLLHNFNGIVVIDEAYINFAKQKTFIPELMEYPNLVVLQTFSKAWGLAGLRLGMAFAGQPIIDYLNKVKYPYNINAATQQLAIEALDHIPTVNDWIHITATEREWLIEQLSDLEITQTIHPSDANFLLVKIDSASKVYEFLQSKGIIVRDRSNVSGCENCLRITVGTPEENRYLVTTLKEYAG